MHPPTNTLILLVLSSAVSAIFFTKSGENDYPRIGRSNVFTSGNGNNYPRIGRRDAIGGQLLLPGLEYSDLVTAEKRGVFTKGPHGSYPRVGRTSEYSRNGEDYMNEGKELVENPGEESNDEIEANHGGRRRIPDTWRSGSPLELMFVLFDINNDGKLSKGEFISGLGHYPQHKSLY